MLVMKPGSLFYVVAHSLFRIQCRFLGFSFEIAFCSVSYTTVVMAGDLFAVGVNDFSDAPPAVVLPAGGKGKFSLHRADTEKSLFL